MAIVMLPQDPFLPHIVNVLYADTQLFRHFGRRQHPSFAQTLKAAFESIGHPDGRHFLGRKRLSFPVKEENKFDPRLEKVKALPSSIRKNEKMNALDFEILDEKEERKIGKEVRGTTDGWNLEGPAPERNHAKEESRPADREREREREYEPERGGMEMGM